MFVVTLVLGVALAAVGGDRFVRGTVGLSIVLRIPAGVIAATVAAFATSSPELTVSVIAAVEGDPGLALGDATGSNLVNLGMVLGLSAVTTTVVTSWPDIRRDLPVALAALVALGLFVADGQLSRPEAVVLLVMFALWITWATFDARHSRRVEPLPPGDTELRPSVVDVIVGLVLLVASGWLMVSAASDVAVALSLDEFVVGALVVAMATSAPELAIAVISARRGRGEIGVGALLGSNVFNSLFVVGVAGSIAPITVSGYSVAVALGFGLVATVAAVPDRAGHLNTRRGVVLLAIYAAYVLTLLATR